MLVFYISLKRLSEEIINKIVVFLGYGIRLFIFFKRLLMIYNLVFVSRVYLFPEINMVPHKDMFRTYFPEDSE